MRRTRGESPYGVRRARRQLGGVAAIVITVLLLCALAASVVSGLAVLSQRTLRQGLVEAPPARSAVSVSAPYQARLRPHPGDPRIAGALRSAVEPLGGTLIRTVESPAFDFRDGVAAPRSEHTIFWSVAGAEDLLRLSSGSWPAADRQQAAVGVAVPDLMAQHYDLQPGDRFSVRSRLDERTVAVVVTGTWTVREGTGQATADDGSPRGQVWLDQPMLRRGHTGEQDFRVWGPLLLPNAAFADVSGSGSVTWQALPDWPAVTPGLLDELRRRADGLGPRMSAAAAHREDPQAVQLDNPLPELLGQQARGLVVFRSLLLVPTALLAVLGACGLVLTATLLAAARSGEEALLRSRGASPGQLVRPTAVEALLIGVVGAVGGPLLARLGLTVAGVPVPHAADPWFASAVVALGCAVALTLPSVVRALRQERQPSTDVHLSRRSLAWRLSGLLVLVALGVVSALQLLRYGVSADVGGSTARIDPLLVGAPAALLTAAAVVLLLALLPLVRSVARAARRTRGLPLLLGGRAVSGAIATSLPIALLVALAGGTASFAVEQGASQDAARAARAAFLTGGQLRVQPAAPARRAPAPRQQQVLAGTPGVAAAVPVVRSRDFLQQLPVQTMAVDTTHLDGTALDPAVRWWSPSRDTLGELTRRPWQGGPRVPSDLRDLRIHASARLAPVRGKGSTATAPEKQPAILAARPVLLEADGVPHLGADRLAAHHGEAPAGGSAESSRLPAVQVTVDTSAVCPPASGRQGAITVSLGAVSVPTGTLDLGGGVRWWLPDQQQFAGGRTVTVPSCTSSSLRTFLAVLTPPARTSLGDPVPAVVTANAAAQLGLHPGETFQQSVLGVPLTYRVVAVAPYLATVEDGDAGVLVDAGTLLPRLLLAGADPEPSQWWLTLEQGVDPAAVAQRIEAHPHVAAQVQTREGAGARIAGSAASGGSGSRLVLGLVAAAAVLATALFLVAATLLRRDERLAQATVLRALGASRRGVLAVLGWEYALTAVLGCVCGVLAGTGITALLLRVLALGGSGRALVPPPTLVVPGATLAVLVVLLAVIPAAVVLLVARVDMGADVAGRLREQG